MLYQSGLVTAASGSLGGMTASHNRGGQYLRSRVVPVNVNSTAQQLVRGAISTLSTRYSESLTPAERSAWQVYGENVATVNALGSPVPQSAIAAYCRCNSVRIMAGLAIVDAAPVIFDTGEAPTGLSVAAFNGVNEVFVNFDDAQAWVDEDGSALVVQQGRPASAARSFFAGPYRFATAIEGNSVTAPTTPGSVILPWAIASGDLVRFRARISYSDGRLSPPVSFEGIANP